jgi:uncharacterized protein YkwD
MKKLAIALALVVSNISLSQSYKEIHWTDSITNPRRYHKVFDSLRKINIDLIDIDQVENEIYQLISKYRAEHKLTPVKRDKDLDTFCLTQSIAQKKAKTASHTINGSFQSRSDNFKKCRLTGEMCADVAIVFRINGNEPKLLSLAEVMFYGFKTSEAHNKIMLDGYHECNKNYEFIGISVVADNTNESKRFYVTVVFGKTDRVSIDVIEHGSNVEITLKHY